MAGLHLAAYMDGWVRKITRAMLALEARSGRGLSLIRGISGGPMHRFKGMPEMQAALAGLLTHTFLRGFPLDPQLITVVRSPLALQEHPQPLHPWH